MSIAAIPKGNQPQLNRIVTEIPQKIAVQEERKAILYSLAGKVCLVAFLAIAAAAISISFGLLPFVPTSLMVGCVIATIPLQIGLQSCMHRSMIASNVASEASEKAMCFEKIRHWGRTEIEAFFKEHRLSLQSLPMGLLRKVNPKEPLQALLPAIATFQYYTEKAKRLFEIHVENLNNSTSDPLLRLKGRQMGWRALEFSALPAAFQAAHALQVVGSPTLQERVTDLGSFHSKDFDERRFDQLLNGVDEFFVFKDEERTPLTFAEVQKDLSEFDIDALRIKLYPKAEIPNLAHRR